MIIDPTHQDEYGGALPHAPQGSAAPLTPYGRGEPSFFKPTALSLGVPRTRGGFVDLMGSAIKRSRAHQKTPWYGVIAKGGISDPLHTALLQKAAYPTHYIRRYCKSPCIRTYKLWINRVIR